MEPEDLTRCFPIEPIPPCNTEALSDSFGADVEDDLAILRGRKWNEIVPEEFRFHFEVMFCLRPEAFRYYLPAVIQCSLKELTDQGSLKNTELIVDCTLSLLVDSDNDQLAKRRSNLWKCFSNDQLNIISQWVVKLDEYPDTLPYDQTVILKAIKNRRQKGARNKSRGN